MGAHNAAWTTDPCVKAGWGKAKPHGQGRGTQGYEVPINDISSCTDDAFPVDVLLSVIHSPLGVFTPNPNPNPKP